MSAVYNYPASFRNFGWD